MEYKRIDYKFNEVIMTPELAKKYLEMNTNNRNKRQSKIHQYANEMKNGNWDLASDGVIITVYDGVLKNGQHRLEAIIESGVTVPMLVFEPSKEPIVFDRGACRRMEDIINTSGGINGEKVNRNVTAVVGLVYELGKDNVGKSDEFTKIEYIEKHYDLLSAAVSLSSGSFKCASVATAIYCALRCGVDSDVIKRFIYVFNSGFVANEKETSAIVLRNEFLERNKKGGNTGRTAKSDKFKFVQMALNDFVSGKPRKKKYTLSNDTSYYSDVVFLEDFNKARNVNKHTGERNNPVEKKDMKLDYKKTLAEFVSKYNYGSSIVNVLYDWIEYKIDRKEMYKETGLNQFLSMTKSRIDNYGEGKVECEMRKAMANNWAGCFFDN